MSRTIIATLIAATTVLALTACAAGGRPTGAHSSLPAPQPRPSHSTAAPSTSPSPTPSASPVARLSTTPGDELLTFSGAARSSAGSSVAMTFTVHAPVAWNTPAGSSTLAALAAAGARPVAGDPRLQLLDPSWDAAQGVSLAVVDYTARMTAGSWVSGQTIELDLGPDFSEVPLSTTGLTRSDNGPWYLTGPGSGHFVIAFPNPGGAPDPSGWGDALQIYGFNFGLANYAAANAYQLADCRIDITPLGRRSPGVASWFAPTSTYCSAGIGE